MRYTEKGNVIARATLQKGVKTLYHEIKITRPTDASSVLFSLQMPNGKIIERASFTYDGLKQAGIPDLHSDWQRQYYDDNLKTNLNVSHEVRGRGIYCLFVGDTLVEMSLFTSTNNPVGISGQKAKQFYKLPLTQEDFENIFGRPDKVVVGISL